MIDFTGVSGPQPLVGGFCEALSRRNEEAVAWCRDVGESEPLGSQRRHGLRALPITEEVE